MDTHNFDALIALGETVAVIRHARGLKNPDDLPAGSPEWVDASDAFADDFIRALDAAPPVREWWTP
ncbi:hypothetical protein BHUM_02940 [Candidatus Burkholderia humilis]|nr:hypothetical protein BHUM_02940 [Candidatus Burkholderia humilis]